MGKKNIAALKAVELAITELTAKLEQQLKLLVEALDKLLRDLHMRQ